jgi:hypothetical protein
MKPIPLPPVEVLNELLDYNPDTGILSYKVSRGGHIMKGKEAGNKTPRGYRQIKIGGISYQAHRIIWKMMYGDEPDGDKVIDHINQVKNDNRVCNLRLISKSENNINGGAGKPGPTGISYIGWEKRREIYVVRVKNKYIGRCKTLDGAIEILKQYNDDVMLRIVTMP